MRDNPQAGIVTQQEQESHLNYYYDQLQLQSYRIMMVSLSLFISVFSTTNQIMIMITLMRGAQHSTILYFFVSGMGNIAQGGDPLQASVDQKWSCRGQILPILMRFFAKSAYSDGFRERLFFWDQIFIFWGSGRPFSEAAPHFQ